ncbi:MAG: hypothetical protein WC365_04675, partial [Candidatus Babeliales bacterium]
MKKLIIPALCVGSIITVSMLDAGITPVQQAQSQSVAPVATNVQPVTPAQPAVEQPRVEQKNVAAPEQPKADETKKASEKNDEFSDEEFKKQIAELEKLFADMEKEAKTTEKKVETEKAEQKPVNQKA